MKRSGMDKPAVAKPLRKMFLLKQRKYSLRELVSQITPANRHAEVDWGQDQGKEFPASDS